MHSEKAHFRGHKHEKNTFLCGRGQSGQRLATNKRSKEADYVIFYGASSATTAARARSTEEDEERLKKLLVSCCRRIYVRVR